MSEDYVEEEKVAKRERVIFHMDGDAFFCGGGVFPKWNYFKLKSLFSYVGVLFILFYLQDMCDC